MNVAVEMIPEIQGRFLAGGDEEEDQMLMMEMEAAESSIRVN
jgi:hypothetical protein